MSQVRLPCLIRINRSRACVCEGDLRLDILGYCTIAAQSLSYGQEAFNYVLKREYGHTSSFINDVEQAMVRNAPQREQQEAPM
jgi:hypothetical protein